MKYILSLVLFFLVLTGNVFGAGDMQPVSFTDTPDPLASNGEVTYTIEFKNNAPGAAANPVLDVTVPVGFTYISSDFAGCSYLGATPSTGALGDRVHCTAAIFPGSTSTDINITLRAPTVVTPTVFESTATASSDADINPANNEETIKTTVVSGADLTLTKTSSPNPVVAGGIVTYQFDVVNNGPHTANDLSLTDTLPGGLTFVADNASPTADNDADWACSASGQDVTCIGLNLTNTATSTFYFRAKVSASSTSGDITNPATVSSSTAEATPDDNTDTDVLHINPGTDMSIVKNITTTPAISGQNVTFTLAVTNNGPEAAADVSVTDILPVGYTNISASAPGWTCDVSANPTIICTRDATPMAAGLTETIMITAQAPTVMSIVVHQNDASVSTTTADPIPENNTDNVSYDLNADQADLALTKTKSPTPLAVGDIATSVITVSNNGPRDATPVQVVDVLSPNETYVSFNGTDWSCTHSGANGDGTGGSVTCDYSQTLVVNDTAPTLNILTEATHEGTLENRACTGGSEGSLAPTASDTNTTNNCVTVGVSSTDPSSIGTADIIVTKTADDAVIAVNEDSFTYTINVRNREGNTSQEVEFRDTIPQYISAFGGRPATTLTATTDKAGATCTITSALVVCQLGDILLNDEVNVMITVQRPMADGSRTNTASAYSPITGDPNRSNNEDTATVNVLPVAEIELQSKIVTPASVLAGTEATYTIQIRNNGPSIARDVNMTDIFTGHPFTYISASPGCTFNGTDTLTCDMGDMTSGETKSVEVLIRPDHLVPEPANWEIDNTATVTMSTVDSNPNNNEKNVTLIVTGGELDLAIEKSESPVFHEPVSFDPFNLANNLIVYHVEIHNYGPSLATDVRFSDRMISVSPDVNQELTFVRDTSNADGTDDGTSVCNLPVTNPFTPDAAAPSIDCAISELPSGDRYERYLVFRVEDAPHLVTGDVYRDEINVTSRETDTLLGNNVEDERTTIRVETDPQIVKTVSTAVVEVGESFNYTLTITNNGPGYSPTTNVSDNLPAGMVLTGTPTAIPQGTCTGAAGDTSFTCNVDSSDGTLHSGLPYGDGVNTVVNITVPVMVTNYTQDTLNNFANVTTSGPDSNPGNNEDNVTVTVLEPAHIGDRIWHDRNADGIQNAGDANFGAGIQVELIDGSGSVVQTTTTNATGYYGFDVNSSGDYRVRFDSPGAGYRVTDQDNPATTEFLDSDINATLETQYETIDYGENNITLDAGFFKVASIGNRVWIDDNGNGRQDSGEASVPNVNVKLYDNLNVQVTTDIDGNTFGPNVDGSLDTDASGNYVFSNLRPGVYHVEFDKTTLPANYVFTTRNASGSNGFNNSDANTATGVTSNTTLISDENDITWDAGIFIPVTIGDHTWHDANGDGIQDGGENDLANVNVRLFRTAGNVPVTTDLDGAVFPLTTDANGDYLFDNLRPDSYYVTFAAPNASKYVITLQDEGTDNNDSDPDGTTTATGQTGNYVLTSGDDDRTVDAGFYVPVSIGDRVWIDADYNGVQDAGELNVPNVRVTLVRDGVLGAEFRNTNASGEYLFDDLPPGHAYSVRFSNLPANYRFTAQDQTVGADDTTDSDANATVGPNYGYASGQTSVTSSTDENLTFDAGIYLPVIIGDYVWEDTNANGIQEGGEPGIDGVTVTLVIDGTVTGITTTTSGGGAYLFDTSYDLKPNHTYSVQFSNMPASARPYNITTTDAGSDDTRDSDIVALGTTIVGTPIMLSGEQNLTLDAGFYRNASLGNRVWYDDNGNGIQDIGEGNVSGVDVELFNTANVTQGTLTTDANGLYHFENLRPGSYYVVFDKTTLPVGGYVFTQKDAGANNAVDSDVNLLTGRSDTVTLVSNQDDNSTDAGIYIPVSIGDYTWVDEDGDGQQDVGEAVLPNVGVQLFRTSAPTIAVLSDLDGTVFATDTNVTGAYLFDNLRPDSYFVRFTAPNASAYVITLQNQGADNNDSDSDGVATATGRTTDYVLASGDDDRTVDAGFYEPVSVGDRVWIDRDYDGVQDTNEQNLSGVTVTLYQDGSVYGASVITGANGEYLFDNLPQGHRYSVQFSNLPGDYRFTKQDEGADDTVDSDANITTGRTAQTAFMTSGASDLTLDAGVYEPVIIGDYVWHDVNGNGIQEGGEPGIQNVVVTLLIDGVLQPAINDTTDASGLYLFDASYDLKPGRNYSVQFANSPTYFFTAQNVGADNSDSDADASGQNVTATPIMFSGEENRTLDAGIYFGASLGDKVWLDTNGNGIQDGGEAGVDGVQAELFNAVTGLTTGLTQNTAGGGLYHFTNLSPGSYYVVFSNLPANHVFTQQNQAGNNAVDSDVNITNGISDTVTLISGQDDNTTDAGIYIPVSVGDRIWHDINADGNQSGEANIAESVTVTLTDNNDAANTHTVTTANGDYLFTNVRPGNYNIAFTMPANYDSVSPQDTTNDVDDSDVDTGTLATANFDLVSGANQLTWDMGVYNTATIGDTVWIDINADGIQDAGETGLNGVSVALYKDGVATGDTTTTATVGPNSGMYEFTNLVPGNYSVHFTPTGTYVISPQDVTDNGTDDTNDSDVNATTFLTETTTLVSGENDPTWDAGMYVPASIGDRIWLDTNGNGIQDGAEGNYVIGTVTVHLEDENNASVTDASENPVAAVATNTGNYAFTNLVPGTYHVRFDFPADAQRSPLNTGAAGTDSDVRLDSNTTVDTVLVSGENDVTWDAGVFLHAGLGDTIWIDSNGNGIQDDAEVLDINVTVNLYYDGNNSLVDTQTVSAGSNGTYSFINVDPDNYYVEFVLPVGSGYQFIAADAGSDDTVDSDVNGAGRTPMETISSNEFNETLDAGIYIPARLGDRVWLDANANGIQDPNEHNVSDMNVTLYDDQGTEVATTVTDIDGNYAFSGLVPGDYTVTFALTDNNGQDYIVTPQVGVQDDADNSDVNATGGSSTITLSSGANNPNIDAGLYIPVSLGDFVWSDANGNGLQDDGVLSGIQDVNVTLYREDNGTITTIGSQDTNITGGYLFTGLVPGNYYVHFEQPDHFRATVQNSGADDATDSDADLVTGNTAVFELFSPDDNLTLDAGFYVLATISGHVSEDTNNDDTGDVNLQFVDLALVDSNGTTIATTQTDINGSYIFIDVEPGTYTVVETQPSGLASVSENEGGADNDPGNNTLDNIISVVVGIGENDVNNDFVEEAGVTIGDRVWNDENGDGIQDPTETNTVGLDGIVVNLYNILDVLIATTTTDFNGEYLFEDYPEDTYYIDFDLATLPAHYGVTQQDQGSDDTNDSDVVIATGVTGSEYLAPGADNRTFDMGIYLLGTISGMVLEDINDDDIGDNPMAGVEIILYDENGNEVARTVTAADGSYIFTDLPQGVYTIVEVQPDGYLNVGETDGDLPNDGTLNSITVTLDAGEHDAGNDYIEEIGGSIGNYVWQDANGNGLQDPDETGVNAVHVCLEDNAGNPILDASNGSQRCTDTNATGYYLFEGIIPGDYVVVFEIPTGTTLTPFPQEGSDRAVDSNPLEVVGGFASAPVTMGLGEDIVTIDMGLVYLNDASIGDFVWVDENVNGIFDAGEVGLDGVTVNLYNNTGVLVETIITHNGGYYLFEHLAAGTYVVEFIVPRSLGYVFSEANVGAEELDSDADTTSGRTGDIMLSEGEHIVVVDAGVNCGCADVSTDSSDALSTLGIFGMMLLTLTIGLYYVRKEELIETKKRGA